MLNLNSYNNHNREYEKGESLEKERDPFNFQFAVIIFLNFCILSIIYFPL